MGPSKTPATDAMKIKHDKERQSVELQQIAATQRDEMERAKKTDKDALKSKADAAKRKKQQVKKK